jgi:hypothetical protein
MRTLAIPAASTRFYSASFRVWANAKAKHRADAARYRAEARDSLPIYGSYAKWCHMQCLRAIAADNRRLRAICARGFC